ncbi:MAG: coniferyl aldehyde dehydrogenase [Acidobacteriota bacterium]|nr:coniferyl aldehyde dehydrogenase [Acidobacteriota bacterium]
MSAASVLAETKPAIEKLFSEQRAAFAAQPFPDGRERRKNLTLLLNALRSRREELAAAIDADFGGRSRYEVLFSEIYVAANALRHARRHVKDWMQPRRRPVGWPLQPAQASVLPQPLGVVGIIVPWNYPVFLAISPLAGALAAGNRAMLKPSEHTPRTSEALAKLIADTFPPDLVTVVTGDSSVGRAFTRLPFDHLLFTGSTAVGREVMRAAAENLTPVTLELGGKSPAIVAPDANLRRAAADIAYGKLLNAGQTCIAPDYVLLPKDSLEDLITALRHAVQEYYPDGAGDPGYTAVINATHYQRLQGYIDEARQRGVRTIVLGGEAAGGGGRKLAPTLLVDPPDDLAVMRDEIFGPVLPLKTYHVIEDAIDYVNQRPRPLALYLFTRSDKVTDLVLRQTVAGGVCINDTLMHIAGEDLPFGGVGASGMGHYHGREGFDTFSKLKPVFRRRWPGLGRTLRPPYTRLHDWMARFLIG